MIFAEISSSPHHQIARWLLADLAEAPLPWAIPWPCVYEFLRVVTHPRVYYPALPLSRALADLERILDSPSLVLLRETSRHAQVMKNVLEMSGATGNLIHDAHVAALCFEHGVTELLTGDRDFARFHGLAITNPFASRPR